MNRNLIYVIVALFSIVFISCSNPTELEKATATLDDFLKEVYNSENYKEFNVEDVTIEELGKTVKEITENISKYATNNATKVIIPDVFKLLFLSYEQKMNITVGNIDYYNVDESEDGKIYLDFSMELKLVYYDNSTETIIKNGKIKLLKLDDWKIDHYKHMNYPLFQN